MHQVGSIGENEDKRPLMLGRGKRDQGIKGTGVEPRLWEGDATLR